MTVESGKHPPDIAETLQTLAEEGALYIDCGEHGLQEVTSKACTVWSEDWSEKLSGSAANQVQVELIAGRLVTAECPKCGSTLLVKDKGAESSNRNTAKA